MAIRTRKPTSAGSRFVSYKTYEELTKDAVAPNHYLQLLRKQVVVMLKVKSLLDISVVETEENIELLTLNVTKMVLLQKLKAFNTIQTEQHISHC